jgi:hypothetical protein
MGWKCRPINNGWSGATLNEFDQLDVIGRDQFGCDGAMESTLRMPMAGCVMVGRLQLRLLFTAARQVVVVMVMRFDEVVIVIPMMIVIVILGMNVHMTAAGMMMEEQARPRSYGRRQEERERQRRPAVQSVTGALHRSSALAQAPRGRNDRAATMQQTAPRLSR